MRYGPFYKKFVVENRRSGLRIRVRHGKGQMFSRGISKGIGDMPSEFCAEMSGREKLCVCVCVCVWGGGGGVGWWVFMRGGIWHLLIAFIFVCYCCGPIEACGSCLCCLESNRCL